jgi:FkbM family methyltransferase
MLGERLVRVIGHNRAWLLLKTRLIRDQRKRAIHRWLLENPREEVRYAYPLTPESLVLDVGGFRGEWSAEIVRRYDPYIHIFEPIPEFANELADKFVGNNKVQVHAFGLGDRDTQQDMAEKGDESSAFFPSEQMVSVPFRDIRAFVADNDIQSIDLIKINIEGGEYPLLRRMIHTDLVSRCSNLQVQFHDFVPDAERQYAEIRACLVHTHVLTFEYPFVWENWQRAG